MANKKSIKNPDGNYIKLIKENPAFDTPPVGESVNGRPVAKVVRVGSLTAAAGFYRCGVRIYYYACTITPLKIL